MEKLVSVILPVYNGREYLSEAITSILDQTYTNFEFIIINDGSKDDSEEIIKRFSDFRIRYYSQKNQGLAATLNRGILLSKGEYIARMDQDDVSFPKRFEFQVAFLNNHPDYGMVGTRAEIWVGFRKTKRWRLMHPLDNFLLQFYLLFDNPFVHSSMMFRKQVFESVGNYSIDPKRQPPEDYELWSRIARRYKIANLPEILLKYRKTSGSMSRKGEQNPFLQKIIKISAENLYWWIKRSKNNSSGKFNNKNDFFILSKFLHRDFPNIRGILRVKNIYSILSVVINEIAGKNAAYRTILQEDFSKRMRDLLSYYTSIRLGKFFGSYVGAVMVLFYKIYIQFDRFLI